MKQYFHFSIFDAEHYKNWQAAVLSAGIHLVILAFLPVLLKDFTFKKFNDTKKSMIRLLPVQPQPVVPPQVESQPTYEEEMVPQPVKQEVVRREPQAAVAMVKPLAKPLPIIETSVKVATIEANSTPSPVPAFSPTVQWTARHSADTSVSQSQPRVLSLNSDGPSAPTRRHVERASVAPDLYMAKPLSPTEEVPVAKEDPVSKEDLRGIENGFALSIREKIFFAKNYPAASRSAGHEGKTVVAFVLDKNGDIVDLTVQKSSGHEKLDEAAMEAVKKASPFPSIPEKLKRESMSFKLPISFNLK